MFDVIMLVLNDLMYDGRVHREAATLAGAGWRVLIIATQRADGFLPDCETIQGYKVQRVRYGRFGAGLWRPWRWMRHLLQIIQIYRVLFSVQGRAYHAHDLPALLVLSPLRLIRRHRVWIYDSHELYLFMSTPWVNRWHVFTRPVFMRLEGFLARRADAVLTVSEVRARMLAYWYSIPRPTVLHNIVDPAVPSPNQTGQRVIIHTGNITNHGRALTELVEAMALLPADCILVFLGQGESWPELQAQAVQLGIGDRVFQKPPVPPDQVPEVISSADVAVSLPRADSFNQRASIQNKLWEAMAAGLPVVATDLVGQRRLGRRLGVLCGADNDPASIAAALRQVLDAPDTYRARVQAAQQEFTWDVEAEKLGAIYRRLLECTS